MSTDPVSRLNAALEGRYRIESELGEGGMATVYLAEDLKHEREVALKVLKPELAAVVGAERFLAEIKTTAKLQHPHILPLHDSGEADGLLFYVMPYVRGESLRERLEREHQLPVDDAVRIATNMAEALDYAHRQGVIHRDIKPANVMLQDGKPVIADFGIALAVGAAGAGRLTETGLSLGTPYYMSPEQATGDQHVGATTDTYALGCVLYEMLVGDPPFPGSTAQAVLGKIIAGRPVSAREHRPSVPPHVDAAIRCALEKLPADRFPSTQAFGKALTDSNFRHAQGIAGPRERAAPRWAMAAVVVAIASTSVLGWALVQLRSDAPTGAAAAFSLAVGEEAELYLGSAGETAFGRPTFRSVAISPDGRQIVYSAWGEGIDGSPRSQLYSRPMDQEQATPIPGTDGAFGPFFSPDGEWLGFHGGGGALSRLRMSDGSVEILVQDGLLFESSWGDRGTIVTASADGLTRVASTGGEPTLLAATDLVPPGFTHYQPHVLPGGRTVLFTGKPLRNDWEEAGIFALEIETGEQTLLLENATNPHYAESGHLFFVRQGALLVVGFDPDAVEVEGEPIIVLPDVMQSVGMPNSASEAGSAQLAISASGHLVYARGGAYPSRVSPLLRVAQDGAEEVFDLEPQSFVRLRMSPGGDRLAYTTRSLRSISLYVYDLNRRTTVQLDAGGFRTGRPEWSPDGRYIAFNSDHEDFVSNVYRMASDGSGRAERLAPSQRPQSMMSWSSQGTIVYLEGGDLWTLPSDGEPTRFFASSATEHHATFSPDGRWLAYSSDQDGRREIYVRPFPEAEPPIRVSSAGGVSPTWSPDGSRIYFLTPGEAGRTTRRMMAADVSQRGNELLVASPTPFIEDWTYGSSDPSRFHDVLEEGAFLVDDRSGDLAGRERFRVEELHVILNFLDQVKERVGG